MARKKFDMRKVGMDLGKNAGYIGTFSLGMIGSKKFLDIDVIFKNQTPDSFIRKYGGFIKFLVFAGIVSIPAIKNEFLRTGLMGVAAEGFITGLRQMTINRTTGEAFWDKIGQGPAGWGAPASQQPGTVAKQLEYGVSGTDETMPVPGTAVSGMPYDTEDAGY